MDLLYFAILKENPIRVLGNTIIEGGRSLEGYQSPKLEVMDLCFKLSIYFNKAHLSKPKPSINIRREAVRRQTTALWL
uniref:NR LBD domain-containing protein n=1 Tax=Steinernema glaseri TaxID=37863 RepID=A0A1I7Z6J1_9BILA